MATIGQHLSNLKSLLNEYGRSSESYTDQFLYEVLVGARAEIIKNKLRQYHKISEANWLRFCIALELTTAHDCDCIPEGLDCKVLRTKYKIPSVFTSRNADKISVFLFNGKPISILPLGKWYRIKKTTEYIASILNGYIYFWNLPHNQKAIEIVGLFSNPLELSDIPSCNPLSGEVSGQCYNTQTSEFPLEEEYKLMVYKLCMQVLQIPLQISQDVTNDSNANIKK